MQMHINVGLNNEYSFALFNKYLHCIQPITKYLEKITVKE